MMKFFSIVLLILIGTKVYAGNLISTATWTEDGGYKMAQQDQYPQAPGVLVCTTCTISRAWDGTTIKLFGAKGELLTWVTYLNASSAGDALNVMVKLSSFTGTGAAINTGFAGVAVSSVNAWDYTNRPYSLYKYSYLQQIGLHVGSGAAWDPTEYEARQVALRWRRPCTIAGSNDCAPNGGTTFLDRSDHDKFYPDPAVPMEEYAISSFTVSASSSQAIGGEVYISTALTPNATYQAFLTVTEGITVSTIIPVSLYVYNVTMSSIPAYLVPADIAYSDLDMRLTGTRFPASENADPYLTNHLRAAAFLHRHRVVEMGMPNVQGQDYPDTEWQKHIDGSAYRETYGSSPNTGPGYGIGDPALFIGTYGKWVSLSWSTTTVTNGSTGYCDNVSSWTYYCTNNNLNCQLYTTDDEASDTILANRVAKLSTWSSTAPACAIGGHTLPFFQTGNLHHILSSAPYVTTMVSTSWLGQATSVWQNEEAISTYTIGAYNSNVGVDSLLENQESGLGAREPMWGDYKTGQKMHFIWEIAYWNDTGTGGQSQCCGYNANASNDNNLYKNSKTFGYDLYPTTDTVKGHTGFSFGSDGVMIYPATDSVFNPSFGFNGVVGSWKLNMLTRGIQDIDLLKQAAAINPSQVTTLVNAVVQDVMYLRQCFTLADCTYVYGDRPWSEDRNLYETTREALLNIISGTAPGTSTSVPVMMNGTLKINGNVTLN